MSARARRPRGSSYSHTKVPEITPWFWATKILMTATGEAISDALNQQLGPAIAVPLMIILMGVTLRWQLRQDRYRTVPYWSVVGAVAIFGTSAADGFHVGIGMPYWATSAMYAIVLTVVFVLWHRSEGTLSIHSVLTRRREWFYWVTVLATFALGTALGDFTADDTGLGYVGGALLFGALIALIAGVYFFTKAPRVLLFWAAFVLTRPLGATLGDTFTKPLTDGGLGLGTLPSSAILAVAVVALVALTSRKPARAVDE